MAPYVTSLTERELGTVKGMRPAVPEADRERPEMAPVSLSRVAVSNAPDASSSSWRVNSAQWSSYLLD